MLPNPARVRAFDWLRGLAVVCMVECHALALLQPSLRVGPRAAALDWLNGLVAPSFIFAAGFSLALVQVRTAVGPQSAAGRVARVRKTLRRVGEVLGVGLLINFIWFPVLREPRWLLRMDILPCIGVSLLLALPVIALLAPKPRALSAVLFLLALAVFAVAPLAESVSGPWALLLNRNGDTKSLFPLLPWAGYVLLGGGVGALSAVSSRRTLAAALVGVAALGKVLHLLAGFFVAHYPPHLFFVSDPANHGYRWSLVCVALLGLLGLEALLPDRARRSVPVRWVELLGTTSLAGYFFHEELLFFPPLSVARFFRDRCTWGSYALLLLCVLVVTTLLTWLTDRAYPLWDRLWTPTVGGPVPSALSTDALR